MHAVRMGRTHAWDLNNWSYAAEGHPWLYSIQRVQEYSKDEADVGDHEELHGRRASKAGT